MGIDSIEVSDILSAIYYYKSSARRKFTREFIELVCYRLCENEDSYYGLLYRRAKKRLELLYKVDPQVQEVLIEYIKEDKISHLLLREVRENLPCVVDEKKLLSVLVEEMAYFLLLPAEGNGTNFLEMLKRYIELELIENMATIFENNILLKKKLFPDREKELREEINANMLAIELSLEYAESLREEIDRLKEEAKALAREEILMDFEPNMEKEPWV